MDLKTEELQDLVGFFSKIGSYKARDAQPKNQHVMQRCLELFALDYEFSVLPNTNGELSTNYPTYIVILQGEKERNEDLGKSSLKNGHAKQPEQINGICEPSVVDNANGHSFSESLSNFDFGHTTNQIENNLIVARLKELCTRARFARCRARFPVPVILYNKKYVCRSATLSGGPEIYGRSSLDFFFSGGSDNSKFDLEDEIVVPETQSDWQLFDRVRSQDIRLLRSFQVHSIVDLMVEKKKVKFGVNVTSSEKVDKNNRYSDFNVISLPYPGCEFFKTFKNAGYNAEDLMFEWNQSHADADLYVPISELNAGWLNIDWAHYTSWDLVILTQNYLKLILHEIHKGVLVHCISGWDRTPLFISLIRISLWADGVIHKSLNAEQLLYLTISYDWMLFGHNLEDRLAKGEEIFFFCFYFLKHIIDEEYSIHHTHNEASKIIVRNDSDNNLDSVLLDDSYIKNASPKGSNWSLDSCSSCQSHESQPPTYFQVTQGGSSWEDCNGILHPISVNGQSSPITCKQANAQKTYQNSSDCSNENTLNLKKEANLLSSPQPIHNKLYHPLQQRQKSSSTQCFESSHNKRSSPVAVPLPIKDNYQSSSSVSTIGSWQLISGTGSLKETISSSDPGVLRSRNYRGDNSEISENVPIVKISPNKTCFGECTFIDSTESDLNSPAPFNQSSSSDSSSSSSKSNLLQNANRSERLQRLQTVRSCFYSVYASTIGFQCKHINGSASGLGFLIGNFANKVGISRGTRSNV